MKPTLMNVHICSMDKVNKSLMLSVFLAYKLRHGFIQCSKEKAEQTYQLDFERSDVCSWLSLSGSHWHDDLFEGANEHLGLAQDMGMSAVYFNVNPDGSAFFELARTILTLNSIFVRTRRTERTGSVHGLYRGAAKAVAIPKSICSPLFCKIITLDY